MEKNRGLEMYVLGSYFLGDIAAGFIEAGRTVYVVTNGSGGVNNADRGRDETRRAGSWE